MTIRALLLVWRLEVPPISLLAFGLLSQTMILWSGISGAIVVAAFARTDPTTLTVHASLFFAALNMLWLPLYWRMADRVGIAAGWLKRISQAGWLALGLTAVILATALLGPEVAMLAAHGPIIMLRYLVDEARIAPSCAALLPAWRPLTC